MTLPPDYDHPDDDTVRVVTWNLEHFVDAALVVPQEAEGAAIPHPLAGRRPHSAGSGVERRRGLLEGESTQEARRNNNPSGVYLA
jgi:hypothetical protein